MRQLCTLLGISTLASLALPAVAQGPASPPTSGSIGPISFREALIYRDWQDAIGDAVLARDEDSPRRYKIIGYEKFEEILQSQSLWMEVFRDSIVDIDFESVDPSDFRAKQLHDLAAGVSKVLVAISSTDESDLVHRAALDVAGKIIAKWESSKA